MAKAHPFSEAHRREHQHLDAVQAQNGDEAARYVDKLREHLQASHRFNEEGILPDDLVTLTRYHDALTKQALNVAILKASRGEALTNV